MKSPAAPSFSRITAVILAGGAGRRMGSQPKALLPWRGRPFIAHIVEQLRPQVSEIVINSTQPELFAALQLAVVADPFPERRGPLAGMLAGLRHSSTPLTLFVPCDTPSIAPDLAARLYRSQQQADADAVYATTGGDAHYLFALLRSALHENLEHHLAAGDYAVRHWYATLPAVTAVAFDDEAQFFTNINTPDALQQLDQTSQ